MSVTISAQELQKQAQSVGLKYLGISDLAPLERARKHLTEWQAAGMAGEMEYMLGAPDTMCTPALLAPGAKSAALFAIYYEQGALPARPPNAGRVARYAWGEDYHRVLPIRIKQLVRALESELGIRINFKIYTDSIPILEREWASASGLGFFGKNTLLIHPGRGSFFFVAEVLWDLKLEGEIGRAKSASCGSCSRCLDRCPTGALVKDYSLDARRCISYLTIEKKGVLDRWQSQALGEWLFGCDICQEVCPFNYSALKRRVEPDFEELSQRGGVGAWLGLEDLLLLRSGNQFRKRFGESALMRAGRENMVRNAVAVTANMGFERLISLIESCALQDSSEVVRAQAVIALRSFRGALAATRFSVLIERLRNDSSPFVQNALVSMM